MILPEFRGFPKIPRLSRDIIITEKIDGTCGLIFIDENNNIYAGSKNKWLDDHNDNHGFWHWVMDNKEELLKLGKGYHYGEFWGKEIQRGYGLEEKRFSLFNVSRWIKDKDIPLKDKQEYCPECCYVVPILYEGIFDTFQIENVLTNLKNTGSYASSSTRFANPEGIIIYHKSANVYFKKTILNDNKGKDVL